MEKQYKYYAFISYSSHDTAWGKRLQRKLEGYRMPATLCSEHGWERKPLKPVFFAPTDIQPGGLSDELQERLKASRHLIVICSPHSAQSEWVGKEIAFFHSLERTDNIHFFIIDGIPHSGNKDTECFNPVIEELGLPEILGANIHEKVYRWPWMNRERAHVQLITKLLGVEFDTIWQRHRRLLLQKVATYTIGIITVIAALLGVYINTRPVDVNISLNETTVHNDNLPPLKDALVTLHLDNETKTDTILSLDNRAVFANIPHNAIGKNVHLTVRCNGWQTVDTTLVLTNNITINMARNPHYYGDVTFRLWSINKECGIANIKVSVAGLIAVTDTKGYVNMFIPLEKQNTGYFVESELELEDNILTMPTTKGSALLIKD